MVHGLIKSLIFHLHNQFVICVYMDSECGKIPLTSGPRNATVALGGFKVRCHLDINFLAMDLILALFSLCVLCF